MKKNEFMRVIKTIIVLNIVIILIVILSYCAKKKDYSAYKVKNIIEFHRGIEKK